MNTEQLNLVLADDDEDDRDLFRDALNELPFKVQFKSVSGGESLMEYLKDQAEVKPDMIFLDLNMPRKNGFECLEEIKASADLRHIPVIIFSTSYDEQVVRKLYETGAQYYMQKPSGFNLLKQNLAYAINLTGKKGIVEIDFDQFILANK